MASKQVLSPQGHASLPRIIKLQVGLAVVATAVTVALALYIPQLVKARNDLKSQIEGLTKTYKELQDRVTAAQKQLADTQNALADQDSRVGHTAQTSAQTSAAGARIFEHIGSQDQRPHAKQVAEGLQRQGFAVPGVQILVDYKNPETQVRYVHPQDETEARRIAEALAGQGVKQVTIALISGYENTVHLRQFEIWFGTKAW